MQLVPTHIQSKYILKNTLYFSSNNNTNKNHLSRYLFTQEVGLSSQNFHSVATGIVCLQHKQLMYSINTICAALCVNRSHIAEVYVEL